MLQLISSVRWALPIRAVPALALAAVLGCDSSDEPTSVTELTPTLVPAESFQSSPLASFSNSSSSSFRGGIPFGTWALPTEEFGGVFNGAHRNIWPRGLLKELAAIKARGGKVVLALAGPEWFYQDQNGYFSLQMWKDQVDRFKGVDFTSYLEDGTIIGHFMIDEPNDPRNWNNRPVDGPMLEQMAAYSKQLWPKLKTVVRARPSYMARWGPMYRQLDVAWAMWWTTQGDPGTYIRREVADAQRLGLGLITGLNIKMGGPNHSNMDPSVVRSAGSALLAESYPCAFISWEYVETYIRRDDVQSAMADLSQLAQARPTRSCQRTDGGSPPPPPPPPVNQPPTAFFTAPSCTAGGGCQFTDGSSDSDGQVRSWSWNFGDGSTSSDKDPTHTYAGQGSYRVELTVTDDDGVQRAFTATVEVARAPRNPPNPTVDLSDCTAGVPCSFRGSSAGDGDGIVTWSWSFGDGGTSSERNPSHTYATANSYTVTLTVTDEDGQTGSVSSELLVAAPPNRVPTAEFTAPACTRGVPCQFTDGSTDTDGSIVSRSWSFEPGASSTQTNPVHTFAQAGSFTVTLSVTDDDGGVHSVSRQVTVTAVTLPDTRALVLSGNLIIHKALQKVRLSWTGAAGSVVEMYKNNRRELTNNDGLYIRALSGASGATYVYRVCEQGTSRCSNEVTVTVGTQPISLAVTGSIRNGREQARLRWTGAQSSQLDVYRDAVLLISTRNDGLYVSSRLSNGPSTAVFQVCERGTTTCSNSASVSFP